MRSILSIFLIALLTGSLQAQSLEEAKRLTLNEQFEAASSMFKDLVSKFPVKGDYWFYFGENCMKADELDSAKTLYSIGTSKEPENPLNYIGLGKVYKLEGNQVEANNQFTKALAIGKGKNSQVLMLTAEAYISIDPKSLDQAFILLKDAEKLEPKSAIIQILNGDAFLENNDGSSAIKFYEKAQDLDPKSPLAALRLGQLWVRARNYQGKDGAKGALEYYKEAIGIDPSFAPAYRELGELYAKAQRYQEAKENYSKYLELSKGNTGAKIRYASFLFVTKDYKEALKEIETIYAIDTTRNLLNRLGAYSSFELKEYEKGLSFMQRYMARQPEAKVLASDFAYYGKLLAATGQDSLAIEQLQLALKRDTTDAELLSELASTYAKTKDFNNCVATYQKKIELKKATTNDYYRMGQAYYQMQDFGKADTAFMRVTEIQPKLIVGYLWRARANSSLDPDSKQGLAKPYYDQVVQVGEEDSTKFSKELLEAYKYLGFYYYITKDYENSRINWEKVKGIEPTNAQALDALKDLKSK